MITKVTTLKNKAVLMPSPTRPSLRNSKLPSFKILLPSPLVPPQIRHNLFLEGHQRRCQLQSLFLDRQELPKVNQVDLRLFLVDCNLAVAEAALRPTYLAAGQVAPQAPPHHHSLVEALLVLEQQVFSETIAKSQVLLELISQLLLKICHHSLHWEVVAEASHSERKLKDSVLPVRVLRSLAVLMLPPVHHQTRPMPMPMKVQRIPNMTLISNLLSHCLN